nr:uncharacterized protein LOC127335004 isoform X3 [Lolium perenne]XP_051217541.1 uncharacterized protein LOC127335004 isoform X4 [Lolium perenne]XP_051217542.1 uncharacterized protein LOC127335004 isoform X5 [Lolium perenne]
MARSKRDRPGDAPASISASMAPASTPRPSLTASISASMAPSSEKNTTIFRSEAWQSVDADAGYPDWVLLNMTARISKDANETTAKYCAILEGRTEALEVTFCLVHPPDVSRFSVHSPGLRDSDPPPFILCAEGPFVLFCVTLNKYQHFFVYTASGEPSLHRLPEPDRKALETQQFGLLPCSSSLHYQVVFLDTEWTESTDHDIQYYAYVYSSKTTAWRRSKPPLLHLSGSDQAYFEIYGHASCKQITVGADSVGWVDLQFGIILARHLSSDRPLVEFIALPRSRVCITDKDNDPYYAPEFFCDVICCGHNMIRFVELDFDRPDCRINGNRWKAITWDRHISWDDWHKGYTVDVDDIYVDQSYSSLLPELLNEETQLLELRELEILIPTLSMHEESLLYMMAKLKDEDSTAWILTIDLKHAALKGIVQVLAKPFYTITFCCPCDFPKYLSGTTTTPRKELVELDASHNKQKKKNDRSHKHEALDQGKYCKKGGLKQGNTHKQEGLNQGERQSKANNRVEPMSRWLLCLSWCMMLARLCMEDLWSSK